MLFDNLLQKSTNLKPKKIEIDKKNTLNMSDILTLEATYSINQIHFLELSENAIKKVQKSIIEGIEFDKIMRELARERRDIASNAPYRADFGRIRDSDIFTLVSYKRYKKSALFMLKDLYNAYQHGDENIQLTYIKNPFQNLHKKVDVSSYKKFTILYTEKDKDKNIIKRIPLTSIYVAKGNGIPISSNALLLPDHEKFINFAKKNIHDSMNNSNNIFNDAYIANKSKFYKDRVVTSKHNHNIYVWHLAHCDNKHIKELLEIVAETLNSYYKEIAVKDYEKALNSTAKLVWLFTHACPFYRGTSWSAEILGTAMLRNIPNYSGISLIRSQVDFLAFGNSMENFTSRFSTLINEKIKTPNINVSMLKNNKYNRQYSFEYE